MVRSYIRSFRNSRNGKQHKPYKLYNDNALEEAMQLVRLGRATLTEAASRYGIPPSTLCRKLKGYNNTQKSAGRPTLFSEEEEKVFVEHIKALSEWGFPFDIKDIRMMANSYLVRIGRTVPYLKNNVPGKDWAHNFLQRHHEELSTRKAGNISSGRAAIDQPTIRNFFINYEEVAQDVPAANIINYDETNLTDDPGAKKIVCKRGEKYPERILNTSKTAISIMFAGAADGTMLNPYVVYKAEHLWQTWIDGGPPGCRYNRSRSGWFDNVCFEDWFEKVVVPYCKNIPGMKLLLGDNLSSHFSPKVLEKCETLNIKFVCLPPKSTHILQPLDVAFYAPLKHYWRIILTEWKENEGRRIKILNKDAFPSLFGKLLKALTENDTGKKNIISGFNKCGLYPIDVNRPVQRIPTVNTTDGHKIKENVSSVVIEMLSDMRNRNNAAEGQKTRRKRVNVSPGKSIGVEDLAIIESEKQKNKGKGKGKGKEVGMGKGKKTEKIQDKKEDLEEQAKLITRDIAPDQPSCSGVNIKKQKRNIPSVSSSSNSSIDISIHSDSDIADIESSPPASPISIASSPAPHSSQRSLDDPGSYFINDTILAEIKGAHYVATIVKKAEKYTIECFGKKKINRSLRFFKQKKPNIQEVTAQEIIKACPLIETQENVFLLFDADDKDFF